MDRRDGCIRGMGGDLKTAAGQRQRPPSRKPVWIIVLVCLVSVFLVCTYTFPPQSRAAFFLLFSKGCDNIPRWVLPAPARDLTDEEIASRVVVHDILRMPSHPTDRPKIAFMFLCAGSLPFEKLWDRFFQGHEGRFSVYIHTSKEKPAHVSNYFMDREVRSAMGPYAFDPEYLRRFFWVPPTYICVCLQVVWGQISMTVDAEKRLLAAALKDPENQHFVLLSDSCVPLHSFDYVYDYLMHTNISFLDSFYDPGPHGNGRYSENMLPEVEKKDFRKGAQWFTLKRQHALIVMADSLYYTKFRNFCKSGQEGRSCIPDEHYLPTFFNMVDPGGIANWSVTHVDWSERKWHPKSYRAEDITFDLLMNIMSIKVSIHVTSDDKHVEQRHPCLWNGAIRPCYLFARKFYPECLDNLLQLLSNYTAH